MDWLQYLISPLLIAIGGIIAWFIKSKKEEYISIENRLTNERREIYLEILSPLIHVFTDTSPESIKNGIQEISSFDYRKNAFKLNFYGSDNVIKAYNNLWKHAYQVEKSGKQNPKVLLHLFGNIVLEMRKNLGNKKTKLTEIDMLQGMVKNIGEVMD